MISINLIKILPNITRSRGDQLISDQQKKEEEIYILVIWHIV